MADRRGGRATGNPTGQPNLSSAARAEWCVKFGRMTTNEEQCSVYYYSIGKIQLNSDVILGLLLCSCLLLLYVKLCDWNFFYKVRILLEFVFSSPPKIQCELPAKAYVDQSTNTSPIGTGLLKNGTLSDPSKPGFIQCFDPSTLRHLGQVKAMTSSEVDAVVSKAAAAQPVWSRTSFAQRRKLLRTLQKFITENAEEICVISAMDSGKTQVDALLGEVMTTCEKIRCINSLGELWLRKEYRPTSAIMIHKSAYVEYVPLGVLGVIAPWNYPFHNFLNHVISGLFAGNAVVCKVSEYTSWSALIFEKIIHEALRVNGHSTDLVQIITGLGDAGETLVQCSLIDKIIFTGSPAVGRKVMEGASKVLKPVVLELGGKDPMVFCEDVNIKNVAPWAMRGCFQNCGQNCCGIERLFVYEGIYDEFISTILPKVKALRQGEACSTNVDCSAMVMERQMDIIQELIDDAVAKGAVLHCGGKRNKILSGQFYEPTLISNVTEEMRIFHEELFGPVMCIIKVPSNDDEKCIHMINQCKFGLGSSVYSKSQKRAEAVGKRIRSGMFTANDFGVNYLIQSLPFGGVRESGFGRFAGPEGLRSCCLERSIVVDRIPGVRTSIPDPIDYPIESGKGLSFGIALVNLFYSESAIAKLQSIVTLMKSG